VREGDESERERSERGSERWKDVRCAEGEEGGRRRCVLRCAMQLRERSGREGS
jgi:hypothetical protein